MNDTNRRAIDITSLMGSKWYIGMMISGAMMKNCMSFARYIPGPAHAFVFCFPRIQVVNVEKVCPPVIRTLLVLVTAYPSELSIARTISKVHTY